MIRAPEKYDPIDHPVAMRVRRNDVLKRMGALGMIDEQRETRLKAMPSGCPSTPGSSRVGIRRSS